MNQVYNTQDNISSSLINFLKKVGVWRKSQLKIIPFIVIGMILAESVVSSDIAKKLKNSFSFVNHDSITKRLYRFFNNKLFNPYSFYDSIIRYVINHYKLKHEDGKLYISLDHMFCRDKFAILLFSLSVGKQSIPLWFRCFKGYRNPDAFKQDLFIQGIDYVYDLFKDKNYKIIFTADRFFNSSSLLKHIEDIGCFYCVRAKTTYKVFIFDKKENHYVWKYISDLPHYVYHSVQYDIFYTRHLFKTSLVISKSDGTKDPWYLLTNLSYNETIKVYGKRFGSIEFLFKEQKSNGFNLEKTATSNIKAFESLYSLCCFSHLFITIIGVYYNVHKSGRSYKTKIVDVKNYNKSKRRIRSYFEVGLILFNKAYNSSLYIYIPFTFILYDP